MIATVAVLVALDLGIKAWAERDLADERSVDLGVIQLRLTFNPGVSFGLGDGLPSWLVLTVTGLLIAALATFSWRFSRAAPMPVAVALAVVLAGAVANFLDRAADGKVTDYLHTGWFPTFNGADIYITLGAIALGLAMLRAERAERSQQSRP
nr:signal peptidase II [Sporichthya polymorpha]